MTELCCPWVKDHAFRDRTCLHIHDATIYAWSCHSCGMVGLTHTLPLTPLCVHLSLCSTQLLVLHNYGTLLMHVCMYKWYLYTFDHCRVLYTWTLWKWIPVLFIMEEPASNWVEELRVLVAIYLLQQGKCVCTHVDMYMCMTSPPLHGKNHWPKRNYAHNPLINFSHLWLSYMYMYVSAVLV